MTTYLTSAQTAATLRLLADAIEAATNLPIVDPTVYLTIPSYTTASEPERIAAVDAFAAAVGEIAKPTQETAGSPYWKHRGSGNLDGLDVVTYTSIDAPPHRCTCGAVCHHQPGSAAA
jgi:hypothetical protein